MATQQIKRIHPKKFALWMAMISMIMFFAAFTSAYIVRKAASDWLPIPIPDQLFISTGVILASSISLHVAYKSFIAHNYNLYKILLSVGFALGLAFVALQYLGWLELNKLDIFLHTNQSSSFTGLLIGVHVMHVLGGITALFVSWLYALKKSTKEWTPKRQLRLELTFTYWHFVDLLWVYLLLFFWFQQ